MLGLYYMTRESINSKGEGMIFADVSEVHRAYQTDVVSIHAKIKVRISRHEFDEAGRLSLRV